MVTWRNVPRPTMTFKARLYNVNTIYTHTPKFKFLTKISHWALAKKHLASYSKVNRVLVKLYDQMFALL